MKNDKMTAYYIFYIDGKHVKQYFEKLREDSFPPYVLWKGEIYDVPCFEQLEYWVFDSVCETPDEDRVEPDHPDSWLSILGLI